MTLREKLEQAQDVEYHLKEAAYHLGECQGTERLIDDVNNILIVQHFVVEQLHKRVEEKETMETNELVREYWRSVI